MSASSQLCPDVAACNVKAEVTQSEYNSWMKLGSKGSCLPLGPKTLVIETTLENGLVWGHCDIRGEAQSCSFGLITDQCQLQRR